MHLYSLLNGSNKIYKSTYNGNDNEGSVDLLFIFEAYI